MKSWLVGFIAAVAAFRLGAASSVEVTAFGAKAGGGARENTAAIQRAVDEAAKAGGGTVTVPKGTFETGSVYLRSGVELHLSEGAVLKGTTDLSLYNADDAYPQSTGRVVPEEWSGGHLVYAVGEKNVAITGPGVMDGNGPAFFGDVDTCYWPWYRHGLKLHPTDRGRYRPGPEIAIVECEGVRIENLVFTNSATWTCLLHGSSDIVVRNYRAINDWTIANSDGLSIDCCRNVLVENATIRTGDDGIAIRASGERLLKPQACENVLVTNCTISSCCYGIRFGVGNGDIRNVRVVGCAFPETACGLGFTCAWINAARNVFIEDVHVADCRFGDAVNALEFSSASDGSPSRIAGISFDRCAFSSVLGGIAARGGKNEAYNPKDIAFRDCTFTVQPDFAVRGEAYSDEIALLPKFKRNAYFGLGPREGFSFARCRLVWPKEDGLWRWRLTRVGDVFKHAQVTDCDFPEPPKFAGGTEPVYVAPSPKPEARYDFRKRLSAPREWRPNGFTGDPIAKDETALDDYWTLVVESDEPVVRHAAADLRDFLEKRCWARCAGTDGKKRIVVAVAPEENPLTSRITAGENEIRVTGATPREAAQGCYRLEDELTRRDQPAVKRGTRTYTRMFSPRMTHSSYEIEKFPDWHMDQIAHAGMDAILVYVTDPPDMTRNGREDFNALVKRAAEHGLDVYAYLDRWGKPIEKHPLDPGAEEYYDRLFGSVVKNAPGLKGMILVGESCSFPSRDEGVYGYAWEGAGIKPDPAHPKKGCNGFWPASDWKECLELISKVTRKYRPDFDLVFWTYNWARAPEKDRLAMLERIPTNVTLHVTFELGDKPVEKLGVRTMLDDYSISRPGPSETFTGEAAVAGRRGIRLSSMTNTGGRTWDFGAIPFEPVPYCWMKRYRALREAKGKYGLKALMDEHHYGFAPNFVADLAKCAFTEETTEADLDACLRSLAERPFGRRNAETVLAAWKDWSDAMEWHAARDFDQYGVLRVGPTYPLAFYGEKIPDPPQCLGDEPGHPGGKWIYVWETAGMKWGRIAPHEIAPYLEMNQRELALWQRGNERLAAIRDIPYECRESSRRLLGLGKYCEHTLRSSCNVKRYWLAGLNRAGSEEIRKILDDETENVKGLIPYVEADSHLGWEPSMRYVTDAPCLRWKLQHLQQLQTR